MRFYFNSKIINYSFFLKLIFELIIRLNELVTTGQGIAILEMGLSLGGGDLQNFGINSNTSANSFLKSTYNKTVSFISLLICCIIN